MMGPMRSETMLLLTTVLIGAVVALQAPLNAMLGREVGTINASVISFLIGFGVLLGLSAVLGQLPQLTGVSEVRWPYFLGGVIGAAFVLITVVAVPKVGAGPVMAAAVFGQLTMAVVIDRQGWLAVPQHDITPARILGVVLLVVGAVLVTRK